MLDGKSCRQPDRCLFASFFYEKACLCRHSALRELEEVPVCLPFGKPPRTAPRSGVPCLGTAFCSSFRYARGGVSADPSFASHFSSTLGSGPIWLHNALQVFLFLDKQRTILVLVVKKIVILGCPCARCSGLNAADKMHHYATFLQSEPSCQ